MDSDGHSKPIRSWLLTILLLLVIIGLLATIATPNFVGGGPSKISGVAGELRNLAVAKDEWAIEHGYTNNIPPLLKITPQDLAPFLYHEKNEDPFTRLHLVIDKDGNLLNPQGVLFVINPLGVEPEARFTKAFKLSDHSGFFGDKIPKGTVMRFAPDNDANFFVEYILPGQESKPYKSLSELLDR